MIELAQYMIDKYLPMYRSQFLYEKLIHVRVDKIDNTYVLETSSFRFYLDIVYQTDDNGRLQAGYRIGFREKGTFVSTIKVIHKNKDPKVFFKYIKPVYDRAT